MPLSETSLCWTCFLATQQYLVNGLDLSIFCSVMFWSIAQNYSLMENSHTYSFEIMLSSPSLPLDPQNTRGRRRWQVSSSSPTLAAFADSVLVSALSLPSRSFTGLQSDFSPVSEEPVRLSHQHQYKEQVNKIIQHFYLLVWYRAYLILDYSARYQLIKKIKIKIKVQDLFFVIELSLLKSSIEIHQSNDRVIRPSPFSVWLQISFFWL